jgi:TolB-like protein
LVAPFIERAGLMTLQESPDSLMFDDFRLERGGLFRLYQGNREQVALGSRALDLLWVLAERAGEIVTKETIFQTVWAGTTVEEVNLTVQISALRRVIDRWRTQGSYIQTAPRRGYRLLAEMKTTKSQPAEEPVEYALLDKPSIAVLPFANLSGDPAQEYFADGMVEEIITALARIHWLFVIARNSSFAYKNEPIDIQRMSRELGVRYLLEGSVRKDGEYIRITARLLDATTAAHLWADRFEGPLNQIFALQDHVASRVAGVIEPRLQAAEAVRANKLGSMDLRAYDFYLRGLAAFFPMVEERIKKALELFEQAIALDPQYGLAMSWAAICHLRLVVDGWTETPETHRTEAVELASSALQKAQDEPEVLANAAFVLASLGSDPSPMLGLIERALALNPNFARGWQLSGQIRIMIGDYDRAIDDANMALRLSPRERIGYTSSVLGRAYFFKRQYDAAAAQLTIAIHENAAVANPYRFLAACYGHMGRLEAAREVITRLRMITDQVIPARPVWRTVADEELLVSGLRIAVMPETPVQNARA